MVTFIDAKRHVDRVEPICWVLPIASSTFCDVVDRGDDAPNRSLRVRTDATLRIRVQRLWLESWDLYGARKVWHQPRREVAEVPQCRVERLIGAMGLQGALRGQGPKTTLPAAVTHRPYAMVQLRFEAKRLN